MADRLFILEEGGVTLTTQKGDSYELRIPGKIIGWSFLVSPTSIRRPWQRWLLVPSWS